MKKKSKKQQFEEMANLITKGELPVSRKIRVRPMFETKGGLSEKVVQNECKFFLKSIGAFCFVVTAGKLYTYAGKMVTVAPKGTSDIVGMLPGGKYIEVECKHRLGGYLDPEQKKHGEEIE